VDILKARESIDKIDDELVKLFEERMKMSAEIAQYKRENNLPVYDEKREQEIIEKISSEVDGEFTDYTKILYKTIFKVSRLYQKKLNGED